MFIARLLHNSNNFFLRSTIEYLGLRYVKWTKVEVYTVVLQDALKSYDEATS
jgi:hypothetical protein